MTVDLSEKIKQYLVSQYLAGDGAGLDGDTPLLELNIIDSSSLFDIVRFLSEAQAVTIPIEEITAPNFATINDMVRLVGRISSRQEGSK